MIELIYFSGSDLMIKVEYIKKSNALRYESHREMEREEREKVEQHIMSEVAPKTDFHKKRPSRFVFLGINKRLEKRLSSFHHQNELEALTKNEKEISASVDELIHVSMCNYYSEKIGDLIVSARNALKGGRQSEWKLAGLKQNMYDVLGAYNMYAERALTLGEIIPSELKPFLFDLKKEQCAISPSN